MNLLNEPFTKEKAKEILSHPEDFEWTTQALGMLRVYLDPKGIYRLHIWDSRQCEPQASRIHDHPWNFDSEILAGSLANIRYYETRHPDFPEFQRVKIQCGVGGCAKSDIEKTRLIQAPTEMYWPRDKYSQHWAELHDSIPEDGTVTIIKRDFVKADTEHATVCWQEGPWGTAEPRKATSKEVLDVTRYALERWF